MERGLIRRLSCGLAAGLLAAGLVTGSAYAGIGRVLPEHIEQTETVAPRKQGPAASPETKAQAPAEAPETEASAQEASSAAETPETAAPETQAPAAETQAEASLEQVSVNMPDLTVYGYGLSGGGTDLNARLGDRQLSTVSNQPFRETGEGIDWYVLLDVSNSIPNSYFGEICDSIADFADTLPAADTGTFITFGESVEVRADLKEDPEKLREILGTIKNRDNRTMLFEGISRAADLARQDGSDRPERKILIVISDGEDVTEGGKVVTEALSNLKEKALPVYALCIRDTAREHINSFGEFARTSGGDISIFRAKGCGSAFGETRDRIMSADKVLLKAPTNRISNDYERFTLRVPGVNVPLNREVFLYKHQPDRTAPEITGAEYLEGRKIRVSFSEPVTGADNPANYILKSGDTVVPVAGVVKNDEGGKEYVLTAAERFEAGAYTLSVSGITDDSQEENGVTGSASLDLPESEPLPKDGKDGKDGTDGTDGDNRRSIASMGAAVIALLTALGALIALFVVFGNIKKNRGVVYVDGKPVMGSNVDVKQHVKIEQAAAKKPVSFLVTVTGRNPQRIEAGIDRSLIVGRSSICDLYFDDARMSKQHFALEWTGQEMYISDLQSTNGTMVNGVRILSRRKLMQGDRISAGSEEMIINW